MPRRGLTWLPLLALAALPAPASAASWTAPQTLSRDDEAGPPVAAMAPGGEALVAWPLASRAIVTAAAGRRGRFERPRALPGRRAGVLSLSAARTRRGAVLAWAQSGPSGRRLIMAVQAGRSGAFGSPQELSSSGPSGVETRVLAGARTVVAWRRTGLSAAEQPGAGQPFGPGRPIATPPTFLWSGALGAAGRTALVWNGGSPLKVRARVWPAGGELGQVATLSNPRHTAREPAIARAGDGFVAAWSEFDGSAYRVRVAFAGPDGRFGRSQVVSERNEQARQPQVALDGRGQVVVSWLSGTRRAFGLPPGHVRVAVARRPGAGFDRPVDLTPPGERDNELRIAAGGGVHLVWVRRERRRQRAVVASRPAGGRFERPRALSTPAQTVDAAIAAGSGDRALVAWTARNTEDYPDVTARLQVARR